MQIMGFGRSADALILSWVLLILPGSAWAREDRVPGSRYVSARGAALGDAFLPLGEDGAAALFYNPAVVGKLKTPQFEAFNLQFYGNQPYLSLFSLQDLSFYKVTSLSNYLPTLQANPSTYAGVGAAVLPNYSMRDVAAGVLFQTKLHSQVNADGTVSYRSLYQLIPSITVGTRLAEGIVRVGYNLQWVNQASGTVNSVAAATPDLGYNQGLTQGSAFSHNLGLALTFPTKYLPAVNVVARNVLGANFSGSSLYSFSPNPSGTPPNEPMSIDASFSIQPKIGSGAYLNLVLEDRDVTNSSGMILMGRLAMGLEFSFRDQIFLRGGWGSGYPSAGIGLRRKGGEFALTWMSEEIGSGYQSVRDVKYMMQYQIRAF